MTSDVKVFYSAAAYEAYHEGERTKLTRKHAAEARIRCRCREEYWATTPLQSTTSAVWTPEQVKQLIADVSSGNDIRKADAHARKYAKTVKVFQGGSAGLGRH